MIVFSLSMPHRGSWNGKWSGQDDIHAIIMHESSLNKELIGRSFFYRWNDGWEARIDVSRFVSTDKILKVIKKNNKGFCGYRWMVDNILKYGTQTNDIREMMQLDHKRSKIC